MIPMFWTDWTIPFKILDFKNKNKFCALSRNILNGIWTRAAAVKEQSPYQLDDENFEKSFALE